MSTPADNAGSEAGSTADQPAVEPATNPPPAAPPPPPPPPSAVELFKTDDAFKDEVLTIARDIAKHYLRDVQRETADATRSEYVTKLKASVVKDQLYGLEELTGLLPDTDNPAAMNEAARKLRLRLTQLQPLAPTNFMPQRQRPTAAELINYGLQIRRANNRMANRFGD